MVTPYLAVPIDRGIAVHLPVSLDWQMVGVVAAGVFVSSLLMWSVPAAWYLRQHRRRGVIPGTGTPARVLYVLIAGQVALTLVVTSAAVLTARAFASQVGADLGFDRDRVLLASVEGPLFRPTPATTIEHTQALLQRLATVPGVEAVSLSTLTPVSGFIMLARIEVPGFVPESIRDLNVSTNRVTPGFFKVFGTPLLAGRDFDDRDGPGSQPVVIVNSALAQRYLGEGDPIGRLIRINGRDAVVVGLVATSRYMNVAEEAMHVAYVPWAQWVGTTPQPVRVGIRTERPDTLRQPVLEVVRRFDAALSVQFRTLADEVLTSTNRERLLALVGSAFSALAMVIAAVGVYGTVSSATRRRLRELAIRSAVGASPSSLGLVLARRVTAVILLGSGAGLALSVAANRAIGSRVYGVPDTDAWSSAAATALLTLVTALSAVGPCLRGARANPADLLRDDA